MTTTTKAGKNSKRVNNHSTSAGFKKAGNGDLCQPVIGASKLKSQLRQAKRLLQKDGLKDELRQTTLLKISQLESAIENNPKKEQERRNAIKYHRIKFFDRKKVTRYLKKAITELELLDPNEKKYEAKKRKLELQVKQRRVDLNYVRHYPKHLKYVALFPGGEYKNHQSNLTSLPETIPSSKEPDLLRNYVRIYIAQSMDSGLLSQTPEIAESQEAHDEDQVQPSNLSIENDEFFEPDMD